MPTQSNWKLRQPYQAFTSADLGFVRDYQVEQLKKWGSDNPYAAPQAMLAATEQGWNTGTDELDGAPQYQMLCTVLCHDCSACHARTGGMPSKRLIHTLPVICSYQCRQITGVVDLARGWEATLAERGIASKLRFGCFSLCPLLPSQHMMR